MAKILTSGSTSSKATSLSKSSKGWSSSKAMSLSKSSKGWSKIGSTTIKGFTPIKMQEYIELSRTGIKYGDYAEIIGKLFTLSEWAKYLHITDRTLQRYKKDKTPLDTTQSEKLIEILAVLLKGKEIFGNFDKLMSWLDTKNTALSSSKPKELLDTSFGIRLVNNELLRIEYGVFA